MEVCGLSYPGAGGKYSASAIDRYTFIVHNRGRKRLVQEGI
jgi:hypothetical protein